MKRVLVADDEPVTLRLHQMVLRQAGVEAALFEDGDSVILEMDSVSPDLAVLDYQLPGKNGLELVAALRAHPKLAGIPIIVVTGYRELELKEALLEAGANEVIIKPFSPRMLRARIEELLMLPA
jgi:DNA-binding response OmpR family regulator